MDKLVTLGGECFEAEFERAKVGQDRDGVYYLFRLRDLTENRRELAVSLFMPSPDRQCVRGYDARIEAVRLNAIRRAFDTGTLSFDRPPAPRQYHELPLTRADFEPRLPTPEDGIRRFIWHKAYWLSYRHSPGGRYPVQFDEPAELEYLGVGADDIRRNVWLLGGQGLLEKTEIAGVGRPTARLIQEYGSGGGGSRPGAETVATSWARRDGLLGIHSRGQLDEDLLELGPVADDKSPLSILFLDLDHFKTLNDTHGHQLGDEVLRKIASVISTICRGKGQLYRYGGDEVVVTLLNHDLREARATAERICDSVARASFENYPQTVTASIGVATYPETTKELSQLLKHADAAMYEAKASGGNGARVASAAAGPARAAADAAPSPARGDVGSRIDAVELWASLQHAQHPDCYVIMLENKSGEEVTIESVALKRRTLHLCPPSRPAKLEELTLPPRSTKRISSWTPSTSPTSTLRLAEPNLKDGHPIEIDIVIRATILGRVKTFSQTVLATVNYGNQRITQFGG